VKIAAVALALLVAGGVQAEARVPRPVVVIERGGSCVEPTEFMRRHHGALLMHQRDRTVFQGVRTKAHSLVGCIECHASTKTGSVLGADGFCQSCHAYAAVRLDCFECHAHRSATARAPRR